MVYSYHQVGYLPKQYAEESVTVCRRHLVDNGDKISLDELALMVKVFCQTRSAPRDFHRLLETTILMRMPELRENLKVLHAIGLKFEESGLCSIDTLKALKKEALQVELDAAVFD